MGDRRKFALSADAIEFMRSRREKCFPCRWIADAHDRAGVVTASGGSDGAGGLLLPEHAILWHVQLELGKRGMEVVRDIVADITGDPAGADEMMTLVRQDVMIVKGRKGELFLVDSRAA